MTYNNPNVDLVNMNAYIKFGELMTFCSQDIKRKRNFGAQIKGQNSGTYVRKMACDNSDVDLVNINAYIKFGEILSISSQDIEWKRNFGKNQRLLLWSK